MAKIETSFISNRVILYEEIETGYYAYLDIIKINDIVVSSTEGITTNVNVQGNEKIEKTNIYLVTKKALEINLTKPGGFYHNHKETDFILKPYTFIQKNPNYKDEYMLIDYYAYSGDIKEVGTGLYYPKAINFEYIFACINDYYYDLEGLLNHIRNMPNIILLEDKILDIPYYNRTERQQQYLDFLYVPTMNEYNELIKDDYDLSYGSILKKIGADKFRKEVD